MVCVICWSTFGVWLWLSRTFADKVTLHGGPLFENSACIILLYVLENPHSWIVRPTENPACEKAPLQQLGKNPNTGTLAYGYCLVVCHRKRAKTLRSDVRSALKEFEPPIPKKNYECRVVRKKNSMMYVSWAWQMSLRSLDSVSPPPHRLTLTELQPHRMQMKSLLISRMDCLHLPVATKHKGSIFWHCRKEYGVLRRRKQNAVVFPL